MPPPFNAEDIETLYPHEAYPHGSEVTLQFTDIRDFRTRFEESLPTFIDNDERTIQDWKNRPDIATLIPGRSIAFNGRIVDITVEPVEEPLGIFENIETAILNTSGSRVRHNDMSSASSLPDCLKERILGFDFTAKLFSSAGSSTSEIAMMRTLLLYVPIPPLFGVTTISKYRQRSSSFGLRRYMTRPIGDTDAVSDLLAASAKRARAIRLRRAPGSITQ